LAPGGGQQGGEGGEEDVVTGTFPLLDNDGKPFQSGSVFNLHQEYSKIYVGGFPTVDTAVQDTVHSTDMNGKIEGLMIGGKEVGLWNYNAAHYIKGANTRNKFVPTEKSELRFDGDGYVKMNPELYFLTGQINSVEFKFKAEQSEGLMFLAGSFEKGYLAIKLKGGKIVFNYKIGEDGDLVELESRDEIELDTWYRVKGYREGSGGELYVNGELVDRGASQDYSQLDMQGVTDLYFGGYPGSDYEDIQDKFFTGCISDGYIATDKIDISNTANITRVNAGTDCTRKVENTLSFMEAIPGYVQMPSATVNGSISVSFMYRTSATQGLLMYMKDNTELYYISLSMLDGALYLYAHPDIQIRTKNPQTQQFIQFNDNKWHMASVTVIQEPKKMVFLQIDDFYDYYSGERQHIPLLQGEYQTFFGGIPDDMRASLKSGVTENDGPFIGCIRDAIVLGQYVDFHDAGITGATIGECGVLGDPIESVGATTEPTADKDPKPPVVEEKYDPIALFPQMKYEPNPPIHGQCQLPVSPALDPDLSIESGFRFGVKTGSFIEYVKKNLPDMMVDKSRFQIDFKTTHSDGIIFFMMNEVGKKDFIALFIKNNRLVYSFDCGSGPSYLETDFTVSDGKWHSVEFSRVDKHGKLVFDSIEVKVPDHSQYSGGSTTNLEVRPNIYLGGLDDSMRKDENIMRNLQINNQRDIPGFIGCLRNLKYEHSKNGKTRMKALGTKWTKNNLVIPCSEKVEQGFFFGPGGGRIRAEKRFRVGLDFDITMMIKPRNTSGILVAVKGRRDYLILQMVDGSIQFTVDNGRGPITAIFKPNDPFEFCNGQWHEIHAVKAKNVVTLSVNKIFAQPGIGVPGVSSTDTNNPLFLGGHPRPGRFSLDINQVNYVGCMKDVVVESNPVDITDDKIFGDIHSHVCPTI